MSTRTWRGTARRWAGALGVAVAALSPGAPAAAQDRDFEPVTDAMLDDPDPADWLHWRPELDGRGDRPRGPTRRGNPDRP
ncbi:MAG: hypothetical protein OXG35_34555, partial [Acidobacteria bacterium]|nr:hypothetical protein [Acidobacteriota bacterium]